MRPLQAYTHILLRVYRLFRSRKKRLNSSDRDMIRSLLLKLQTAIMDRREEEAAHLSQQAVRLADTFLRKTAGRKICDFVLATVPALAVVILVRQLWFEPYEIPTGSMRPTFKEQDRLIVSKTSFGINIPLSTGHVYFDPDLVQRGSTVTFTGQDLPMLDAPMRYFYVFPGTKQYVKRMIGKPGDLLYFYGGHIYGVDKKGKDISDELNDKPLNLIDHIPFLRFDGDLQVSHKTIGRVHSPVFVRQWDLPIVRLQARDNGTLYGTLLEAPQIRPTPSAQDYYQLWGIGNFAMARLLTPAQARAAGWKGSCYEATGLLQLQHHPSIHRLAITQNTHSLQLRPSFLCQISYIPLTERHLHVLFQHMYTARFVVKNGLASRYQALSDENKSGSVPLPQVPDGTYEYYDGKAYQIGWLGYARVLPPDHPMCQFNTELTIALYNLGMEFHQSYSPAVMGLSALWPARYVYYRDGDLFTMGQPLLHRDDPTLVRFLAEETIAGATATPGAIGFLDAGAPLKQDKTLDVDFLRKYGLQVPEKMYLVLGDNHAMSSDSRSFGFIPGANLRGAPVCIFWPPSSRWGLPNQPPYPLLTLPNLIVSVTVLLCILLWRRVSSRRNRLPLRDL